MEKKQRHGCVTAWLVFMLIANALAGAAYLLFGELMAQSFPKPIPQSTLLGFGALAIVNLLLAIMLFQWKKWAFWAFAVSSLIAFAINLSLGLGTATSILGLSGFFILFGILQIRKDGVSAWQNLE